MSSTQTRIGVVAAATHPRRGLGDGCRIPGHDDDRRAVARRVRAADMPPIFSQHRQKPPIVNKALRSPPFAPPRLARAGSDGAVLVRPDGHVAWRGDAVPSDPAELIDLISGRKAAD